MAGVVLAASYYGFVQFGTERIVGHDGHWHIRLAHDMWQRGIVRVLPELRHTIHADSWRDHHLLFHLLYMPLAKVGDLYLAAKLAAWLFATLGALAFLFALQVYGVRYPLFWLGGYLAGSEGLLYRSLMPRVTTLSILFLLTLVLFTVRRNIVALAVLAAAYVWLYDAWPLATVVVGIYGLAHWPYDPRGALRIMLAVAVGLAAGILLNPYFPENVASYAFNFDRSLFDTGVANVGKEWKPYTTWFYLSSQLSIALAALLLAVRRERPEAEIREDDRGNANYYALALVTLVFVGLSLKSRRFVEYSAPFLVLTIAVAESRRGDLRFGNAGKAVAGVLMILCAAGWTANTVKVRNQIGAGPKYQCIKDAGTWAGRNIPDGEMLFTSDWDDFPHLYLNAPKLGYVVGLDPVYMDRKDPELYQRWRRITQGKTDTTLTADIQEIFGAQWVFSDRGHNKFRKRLMKEPGVTEVFGGYACNILRLPPP